MLQNGTQIRAAGSQSFEPFERRHLRARRTQFSYCGIAGPNYCPTDSNGPGFFKKCPRKKSIKTANGGTRTPNTRITNAVLYRLSYAGEIDILTVAVPDFPAYSIAIYYPLA